MEESIYKRIHDSSTEITLKHLENIIKMEIKSLALVNECVENYARRHDKPIEINVVY